MLKEERAARELEAEVMSLYGELLQRAGVMSVLSLEGVCRRVNVIRLKLQSFRGGSYE